MATKKITLKCGIKMESWSYSGTEYLKVSIGDLYSGCGELNSLKLFSDMLSELHALGYEGNGMDRIEGYYGATDDLFLTVRRKILK